jgi:uncharacterized protein with HEPN domain
MLASNLELLRHIAAETVFVLKHTKGKTKDDFLANDLLCHAMVRSLEIIGEALELSKSDSKAVKIKSGGLINFD